MIGGAPGTAAHLKERLGPRGADVFAHRRVDGLQREPFVDAIVLPEETRDLLAFLLSVTTEFTGPHLGPFILPSHP